MESIPFSLSIPNTKKKRVVVIGGGFAGWNFVANLKNGPYQVVLFDKHNYTTFQPLLYQVATAGIEAEAIASPFRKLGHNKGDVHFRMLKVLSINATENTIDTVLGKLTYDFLVIANGMKSNFFGNASIASNAFPLKFVTDALHLRSHVLQTLEKASLTNDGQLRQQFLTILIVGAGPTGVELAGTLTEMKRYIIPKDYPTIDTSEINIFLVEGADRVLPPMSAKSSAAAKKYLEKMGVVVRLGTLVNDYDGFVAKLSDGSSISTGTLIWSAGVQGDLVEGFNKEWTERGRVLVDEHHKVTGADNIYCIGDLALMKTDGYPNGHPGVAQVAIQSGVHLAKNFTLNFKGKVPTKFIYKNLGTLAVIGRNKAVGDLSFGIHVKGFFAWLVWMLVHLLNLKGTKNKVIALLNWGWNYFTYERSNRVIIQGYAVASDERTKNFLAVNQT